MCESECADVSREACCECVRDSGRSTEFVGERCDAAAEASGAEAEAEAEASEGMMAMCFLRLSGCWLRSQCFFWKAVVVQGARWELRLGCLDVEAQHLQNAVMPSLAAISAKPAGLICRMICA